MDPTEKSSLVATGPAAEAYGATHDTSKPADVTHEEVEPALPSLWECSKRLLIVSAPNMASFFLYYVLSFATFSVVGRVLDAGRMASVSVAYFAMSMFALMPGLGMCYTLDTLCSQIYGRDPNSQKQGEVCQRGLVLSTIYSLVMGALLYNCEDYLGILFPDAATKHAAEWLRCAPLYLLPQLWAQTLNKFLASQFKQHLVTVGLAVAAVTVVPFSFVFVRWFGVAGSALAMGAAVTSQLLTLVFLTYRDADARHRFGPIASLSTIFDPTELKTFAKLALPSMVFCAAEGSSFDATVLIAGSLGDIAAATWSSVLTISLVPQSVSGGLSQGAAVTVGQAIGQHRKALARRYAFLAPTLAFASAVISSTVMVLFHGPVFGVMSTDRYVTKNITAVLWTIPPMHICDCVQYVFQGIFSGCGRNFSGAMTLIAALWGVGVPASYALGRLYGIGGVIAGLALGLAVEIPILVTVAVLTFDWEPVEHDDGEGKSGDDVDASGGNVEVVRLVADA
eukprot:CAMPEP_0174835288 /NCGR_PEP_ID=MMETSP1114-20130205/5330_1 /TAXON_ID=312471 /ORGANISM="Neobodo designis, Strain CCAP 1951/1" /LENGTH=508 /DNA_ID=CAMNT_0016069233 /DNA_START=222 /DNA_END=1748 /DNA_ORIENTATION=-